MTPDKRRRGRKTAEELLQELERDPEFLERARLAAAGREQHRRSIREASGPVLDALAAAGFPVETVEDLFNQKLDYQAAIPVLMAWLPRVSNRDVKEAIVRALSVPWAKPHAAPLLIAEFRTVDDDPRGALRWAIGNALEVVADRPHVDDLLSIAGDPRYGRTRQMIVLALGRLGDERAVDVLIDLLEDEELVGHAVTALGKLGAERARGGIEACLGASRPWVRREAQRALRRLDARHA